LSWLAFVSLVVDLVSDEESEGEGKKPRKPGLNRLAAERAPAKKRRERKERRKEPHTAHQKKEEGTAKRLRNDLEKKRVETVVFAGERREKNEKGEVEGAEEPLLVGVGGGEGKEEKRKKPVEPATRREEEDEEIQELERPISSPADEAYRRSPQFFAARPEQEVFSDYRTVRTRGGTLGPSVWAPFRSSRSLALFWPAMVCFFLPWLHDLGLYGMCSIFVCLVFA
jgi:hypothetical protein